MKKLTTKQFIEKASIIHNNKYDYSKTEYIKNDQLLLIICPIHGEFKQTANNHLNKSGCQQCAKEQIINKLKKNIDDFIIEANIIHNNKYDYSKSKIVNNLHEEIIIICPEHGEFKQRANIHLINKSGCKKCSSLKTANKQRKSKECFIEQAENIYGKNKFDYSKVNYINDKEKVEIICNIHGSFFQTPNSHLSLKHGCNKCSILAAGKSLMKNTEDFIKESKNKFNDKFDYSKTNYTGAYEDIEIICNLHGPFITKPRQHLKKYGACPKCFALIRNKEKRKHLNTFIEEANFIHNNCYDYSKVNYISAHKKIEIICPKHGLFNQTPHSHMRHGCPKCSKFVSKQETEWLDSLSICKQYRQKSIKIGDKNLIVDAYDPNTNTIYEYYGDFWHGNINNPKFNKDQINIMNKKTFGELYEKTINRENLIKSAGYNLITIWESDWVLQSSNKLLPN